MKPRKDIPSFWRSMSEDIWLHLGENPYPPTPNVLRAIEAAAQSANRYPDTNAIALRDALAAYVGHGVSRNNILVGNGSDELIDLAVVSLTRPGDAVAHFVPSFFVFAFCAERHGRSVVSIPRTEAFDLPDVEQVADAVAEHPVSLSFIANPNNPSGTLTSREHLLNTAQVLSGITVIDECYFEFCHETLADRVIHDRSLIVFRSLSKSFGFSGLRLGYAIAHEEVIERMERFAMTFPVNALAQAAGIAALQDVQRYLDRIMILTRQRNWMRSHLLKLGLIVPPSATNFLLACWPRACEQNPAAVLADQGIWLSDQTANLNRGVPALRIGIGTEEQNRRVLEAISKRV